MERIIQTSLSKEAKNKYIKNMQEHILKSHYEILRRSPRHGEMVNKFVSLDPLRLSMSSILTACSIHSILSLNYHYEFLREMFSDADVFTFSCVS